MITSKIIGSVYAVGITFDVANNSVPSGPFTLAIPDGYYFLADDGQSDDLVKVINDLIATLGVDYDGTNSSLTLSLNASHEAQWASSQDNYAILWNGTELRGWLRFSANVVIIFPTTPSGARVHVGGVYDIVSTLDDTPARNTSVSQLRADDGSVHAVFIGHHSEWVLRIGYTGGPRDVSFEQWHDLNEAYANMTLGWPYRYYFDDTVTTAYALPSTPRGYLTLTLDTRRAAFDPRVRFENRYTNFEIDLPSLLAS